MIKTFTIPLLYDIEVLDKQVNAYLKELKTHGIKYTIQTSSAATDHDVYHTVTVISEE